jgi:hypothetical protein
MGDFFQKFLVFSESMYDLILEVNTIQIHNHELNSTYQLLDGINVISQKPFYFTSISYILQQYDRRNILLLSSI